MGSGFVRSSFRISGGAPAFCVQLVAVPIGVLCVALAAAEVEDAEAAAEVPERPADVVGAENGECVGHPAEDDIVGRFGEGAAFAAVHADAALHQRHPRLKVGDEMFVTPGAPEMIRSGPRGFFPQRVAHPRRLVMRNAERGVHAAGLAEVRHVGQFFDRFGAVIQTVGHDEAAGVDFVDAVDGSANGALVSATGHAAAGDEAGHACSGGFVDEIEAKLLGVDAFVALRKRAPLLGEHLLHGAIGPEAPRFRRRVDAVAGRTVKAEADVQRIFFAEHDEAVDALHHVFAQRPTLGCSPPTVGPVAIVHRDANEIEAPVANPRKLLLAKIAFAPAESVAPERYGVAGADVLPPRLVDVHVEQIKTAPAGQGIHHRLQ